MDYTVNRTPLLLDTDSNDSDSDSSCQVRNVKSIDNNLTVLAASTTKPLFKPHEPADKYYICYLVFYLLGIATLLPWNFFITADDYWMYKFRNVNNDNFTLAVTPGNRTPLQKEFTSYLSIASAIPNTIFLILSTVINRRTKLQFRMIGTLLITITFFIVTTVFVNVNTDKWQQQFFLLTMVSVVLLNIACAILSGSVFGFVGKFSPAYITAVISGQALGGIFTALIQIISLATGESSTHSAFLYFMVGNVILVLTLVAYLILWKSVYFQHNLNKCSENQFSSIQTDLLASSNLNSNGISYGSILNKIWLYGISEWLVFVITLSVYPGVTVLVESQTKGTGNKWGDLYFVPVVSYLIFNIGDYIGRLLAGYLQWPNKNGALILILTLMRFAFIPLLLLCNAQPRYHLPVFILDDMYYIVIMCLFSLSNGYLANIAIICAPKVVEHAEKEVASSMMAAFLGVGLALGSVLSLLMVKII